MSREFSVRLERVLPWLLPIERWTIVSSLSPNQVRNKIQHFISPLTLMRARRADGKFTEYVVTGRADNNHFHLWDAEIQNPNEPESRIGNGFCEIYGEIESISRGSVIRITIQIYKIVLLAYGIPVLGIFSGASPETLVISFFGIHFLVMFIFKILSIRSKEIVHEIFYSTQISEAVLREAK